MARAIPLQEYFRVHLPQDDVDAAAWASEWKTATCPRCDGPKSREAVHCRSCSNALMNLARYERDPVETQRRHRLWQLALAQGHDIRAIKSAQRLGLLEELVHEET